MLLQSGAWVGKGSVLAEGQSLGRTVTGDAVVENDADGISVRLVLEGLGANREFVIRVAANDVGTYVVSVRSEADELIGTAKLDSQPNLGLLWNEAQTVFATFSLFAISAGCGCRGFLRDADVTYTWEMAFSRKQDVVNADNVISLRPRGGRRRR